MLIARIAVAALLGTFLTALLPLARSTHRSLKLANGSFLFRGFPVKVCFHFLQLSPMGTYAKSSIMESSKSEHAPGAVEQRQARISIFT